MISFLYGKNHMNNNVEFLKQLKNANSTDGMKYPFAINSINKYKYILSQLMYLVVSRKKYIYLVWQEKSLENIL